MDLSSLDQLEMQLNRTEMRLMSGGGLEGLDVLKNLDYRVSSCHGRLDVLVVYLLLFTSIFIEYLAYKHIFYIISIHSLN